MIEAGTVHAIGAGVLLAEIQQMSDATFRVDDWGRVGPDGRPRELHVEPGPGIDRFHARARRSPWFPRRADWPRATPARGCRRAPYFALERLRLIAAGTVGPPDRFTILMGLGGCAEVRHGGRDATRVRPDAAAAGRGGPLQDRPRRRADGSDLRGAVRAASQRQGGIERCSRRRQAPKSSPIRGSEPAGSACCALRGRLLTSARSCWRRRSDPVAGRLGRPGPSVPGIVGRAPGLHALPGGARAGSRANPDPSSWEFVRSAGWRLTEPARILATPLISLFALSKGSGWYLHAMLAVLWVVAVGGLVGGAIARMALVQVSRMQGPGTLGAVRFRAAFRRAADRDPAFPAPGVGLCALICAGFGLLYWLPAGIGRSWGGRCCSSRWCSAWSWPSCSSAWWRAGR